MIQQSLEQLAIAHLSIVDLRRALEAAERRPIDTYAIGLDWYQPEHRNLPPARARYCAAIFQWSGSRWRRVRRMTGPRPLKDIQTEISFQSKRLGYPIINAA